MRRRMCAGSHRRFHRPSASWDVRAKIPQERKALWDVETAPTGAQTNFFDSPVGGALQALSPPQHDRVRLSCQCSPVHPGTDPPPSLAFIFLFPAVPSPSPLPHPPRTYGLAVFQMESCVVGASESEGQGDGAFANARAPTTAEKGAGDAVREAATGTDPVGQQVAKLKTCKQKRRF